MNATGNNKAAEEKKMIDITNMTDAQIAELLTTGMIDITNMTPPELERLLGV
jgi:hypothetical protein